MKSRVRYEWIYEIYDDHGDIIDIDYADKLIDLDCSNEHGRLALVRDEGNEVDGLTDRYWAYVQNAKLPSVFSNAMGNDLDITVPKRFHYELEKHLRRNRF